MTEKGEHGATASWTRAPGPGSCRSAGEALGLREHRVEVLDQFVGREAAVGDAEVHRASRGDDPHAELAGRLHLGLDQAVAPAREDVVVVEDGRAAGECELGEARARGRVLGLRVDARPDRVQLAQPREEVGLLGPGAGERLVEVVVRVDEPRGDDRAPQVDPRRSLRFGAPADRRDRRPVDEQPAAPVLGAHVVHRDDAAPCVERAHAAPGCDSRSPASVCRTKLAFSQNSGIAAAST